MNPLVERVIRMNKKRENSVSNGKQSKNTKFLLVERSSQFEEVIISQIKKLSFSHDWKEGVSVKNNGNGVFIQYQILEQPWDRLFKKKINKKKRKGEKIGSHNV